MPALLGNSSAPRWYDSDFSRLDAYLELLRACRATATEVVLHHGPADERTARVHVLHDDWERVIRRYRDAGLYVTCHVSLAPEFSASYWASDPSGLRDRISPLLDFAKSLAVDQGHAVLVAHGAADPGASLTENQQHTVNFLEWVAERLHATPNPVSFALELRARKQDRPTAAATSRAGALGIVRTVGSERVGICWDIAHDRENAGHEPGWTQAPDQSFLDRVIHIHAHDLGPRGESHYPLVTGRDRLCESLDAMRLARRVIPPVTLEVRWRYAEVIGRPWDVLRESYATAWRAFDSALTRG